MTPRSALRLVLAVLCTTSACNNSAVQEAGVDPTTLATRDLVLLAVRQQPRSPVALDAAWRYFADQNEVAEALHYGILLFRESDDLGANQRLYKELAAITNATATIPFQVLCTSYGVDRWLAAAAENAADTFFIWLEHPDCSIDEHARIRLLMRWTEIALLRNRSQLPEALSRLQRQLVPGDMRRLRLAELYFAAGQADACRAEWYKLRALRPADRLPKPACVSGS